MIEIDQNEKVLRTVRRHWISLVTGGLTLLFIAFIPIVVMFVASFTPLAELISWSGAGWEAKGLLISLWLIIIWMIGWYMFNDYYLDTLVITDKRIFDIEQYGLFRRRSSAFRLDRIQNVSVSVHGILQTFLNYGTIQLETAGEKEDFIAPYVGKPYDVKKFISELQDEEMDKVQKVRLEGSNITKVQGGTSEKMTDSTSEGL